MYGSVGFAAGAMGALNVAAGKQASPISAFVAAAAAGSGAGAGAGAAVAAAAAAADTTRF